MTDLELTKLAALAMGYDTYVDGLDVMFRNGTQYDPLHDDAQAMALVKKFGLCITARAGGVWEIYGKPKSSIDNDLNRAIVECCAKMEQA